MKRSAWVLFVCLLVLLAACSGDEVADASLSDAGSVPDAGTIDGSVPDAGSGSCALASGGELALPTSNVSGVLSGASMNASTTCTQANGTQGPELAYTMHVSARMGVVIEAHSSADLVLSIRTSCSDPLSELACNDNRPGVQDPRVRAVLDPGDYFVIVETAAFGVGGQFTLSVSPFTPNGPQYCESAPMIQAGVAVTGDLLTASGEEPLPACVAPFVAGLRSFFYAAEVPPNTTLIAAAEATGVPPANVAVQILDTCGDGAACLSLPHAPSEPAAYTNDGASARSVYLVVFAPAAFNMSFSLTVRLAQAAPNAVCAGAVPLTLGSTTTLDTWQGGFGPIACMDGAPPAVAPIGNQYFSVSVPAHAALGVRATGAPAAPVLVALPACAGLCLASSVPTLGQSSSLLVDNPSELPLDLLLAVGADSAKNLGTVAVRADIIAAPTNTSCVLATPIANGDELAFQNTSVSTSSLADTCLPTALGPVLFYRAVVPPGQELGVRASPSLPDPTPPVAIRILASCGATTCLSSGLDASGGLGIAGAQAHYANSSGSNQTVLVAVGGREAAAASFYQLQVSIAPPPYLETSIAQACVATGNGTVLSAVNADDAKSAAIPLPFGFDFFGSPVSHVTVSANGVLLLHNNNLPEPGAMYQNDSMPSAGPPNGLVAPLWDDLMPPMGRPGSVRTSTTGSAPNRTFVVSWNSWSLFSDNASDLSFQAHLKEGSHVIEFHYCALFASAPRPERSTGSEATIGLESPSGLLGAQHSFNQPNSVSTASGLRFTPN